MNPHFERAQLLYHQGRLDLAEESLRRSLTDDPDFAPAHALLALCMVGRKAWQDATEEAEHAIGLAPDNPFGHQALARVLLERNLVNEAEKAAKQAVELNPYDADLHSLLALVQINQRRWTAALEQADEGLRLDPDHVACANLRAMALVKLGRKQEADRAIEGALERDPDDAFSHANRGWTALNQSDPNKALEHFREALRLDPTLEYAQAGMVEALKARYLVYRLMLRWFLFMARLKGKWQWAIVIGLYLGTRTLFQAADNNPNLAPILWSVWGCLVAFGIMTWLATPLFNLLLLTSRYGKHILSRDRKLGAIVVGLGLVAALGAVAHWLTRTDETDRFLAGQVALVCGVYVIVLAAIFQVPVGRPRWAMAAAAGGLAAMAIVGFCKIYDALDLPAKAAKVAINDGFEILNAYFVGVLIVNVVSNVLAGMRFENR